MRVPPSAPAFHLPPRGECERGDPAHERRQRLDGLGTHFLLVDPPYARKGGRVRPPAEVHEGSGRRLLPTSYFREDPGDPGHDGAVARSSEQGEQLVRAGGRHAGLEILRTRAKQRRCLALNEPVPVHQEGTSDDHTSSASSVCRQYASAAAGPLPHRRTRTRRRVHERSTGHLIMGRSIAARKACWDGAAPEQEIAMIPLPAVVSAAPVVASRAGSNPPRRVPV